AFLLEELPIGAGAVENERIVVGISPGTGGFRRLSLCPRTGGNRSGGDSRQAHAQKLRSGKAYFFDGVPGGFAVRMAMRGGRGSGAVGMIVVLVMRVLVTVVSMLVVMRVLMTVVMMMLGMIHALSLKSLRLDIHLLRHLGPLLDFLLDERAQRLGRAADERDVDLGGRLLHLREREHFIDLAIEPADQGRRRLGGNHHAGPGL